MFVGINTPKWEHFPQHLPLLLDVVIGNRFQKQKETQFSSISYTSTSSKESNFASFVDDVCLVKIEYDHKRGELWSFLWWSILVEMENIIYYLYIAYGGFNFNTNRGFFYGNKKFLAYLTSLHLMLSASG